MTVVDWIGFMGVTILLGTYFLNLNNKIRKNSLTYLYLNFIGASIACISSIILNYIPFIVLEGCWALVSVFGLIAYHKKQLIWLQKRP